MAKRDRLTEKQELFALTYVTNGKNASKAYREVYDVGENTKETTIWQDAHKVYKNPKVALRIHKLEMAQYSDHILTVDERKQLLTEWAKEGDGKAIDMLNKMGGDYEKDNEQKANNFAFKMDLSGLKGKAK